MSLRYRFLEPSSIILLVDDRMCGFDWQVAVQVQQHTVLGYQVVRKQLTFALNEHQASLLETETEWF